MTDSAGTQTAALTGWGNAPATDALAPLVADVCGAAVEDGERGAAGVADERGRCGADAGECGEFQRAVHGGEWVRDFAGGALDVRAERGFVPMSVGAAAGVLTVSDQFRIADGALDGTGVAPAGVSLSPVAGLAFGAMGVGLTSAAQTMTLTNNGGVTLTIAAWWRLGTFIWRRRRAGRAWRWARRARCWWCLRRAWRSADGSVDADGQCGECDADRGAVGVGVDFTLVANGATTVTVASGGTATFPLLLNSAAGVTGSAAMTCTGVPAHTSCTVTPGTAALGANVGVSVVIQTGVALARMEWPSFGREGAVAVLALLLPVGLGLRCRRRVMMTLVVLLCASGCGAGREIPASGVGGGTTVTTPSGTYPLVVTATSAGIARTVGLTLVVQ